MNSFFTIRHLHELKVSKKEPSHFFNYITFLSLAFKVHGCKMPILTIPFKIRSEVYNCLDDFSIALGMKEIFEAIVPNYFRYLELGVRLSEFYQPESLQRQLVRKYPNSGEFVERLTLHPRCSSIANIYTFLTKTPVFCKLIRISFVYSQADEAYSFAYDIPYLHVIEDVIKKADEFRVLSFDGVQPCSSLIDAATNKLLQLELDNFYLTEFDPYVRLPRSLEILIFTPSSSPYIYGPTPNLRVLVIKKDGSAKENFAEKIRQFISNCPQLASLAIRDTCE